MVHINKLSLILFSNEYWVNLVILEKYGFFSLLMTKILTKSKIPTVFYVKFENSLKFKAPTFEYTYRVSITLFHPKFLHSHNKRMIKIQNKLLQSIFKNLKSWIQVYLYEDQVLDQYRLIHPYMNLLFPIEFP